MQNWYKFNIGLQEWAVQFAENLTVEEQHCWGACDESLKTITLDSSLKEDPNDLWATLLHEILHAVSYYTQTEKRLTERMVRRLEGPLAQALDSIKSLPEWLPEHTQCAEAASPRSEAGIEETDTERCPLLDDTRNTELVALPPSRKTSGPSRLADSESAHTAGSRFELEDFWYNSLPEE